MLNNATYDLMETAAVLSKGLHVGHLGQHFDKEETLSLATA